MPFFTGVRKNNFDTRQSSRKTFFLAKFASRNENRLKHSVAKKPKKNKKNFLWQMFDKSCYSQKYSGDN